MPLDLIVIGINYSASLTICMWHIVDCREISKHGFQVVCKRMGTSRYIHVVCSEYFTISCLFDIANTSFSQYHITYVNSNSANINFRVIIQSATCVCYNIACTLYVDNLWTILF